MRNSGPSAGQPMMKRLRHAALPLCLVAAAASALAAGPWDRQIEFARKLATFQYYDIADIVLQRVENDRRLIGILKANVLRQIGDYYSSIAPGVATTRAGLPGFIDALGKASSYYKKYVAHKSPKREDRFQVRMQLSRVSLAIAEVHLQMFKDSRTPQAQRTAHKTKALDIFKAAVAEFRTAIAAKKREVELKRKQKPKDLRATKARARWEKEYNPLRVQYFRVQLEHLNARVRYARLLRGFKLSAQQWQAELKVCADAYRQLLLDFVNSPGEVQANLYLGICRMEQGPKSYKEALLRFETVWRRRSMFRDYKRVPCEAAYWTAFIQKAQKKYREAIHTIDDLMRVASSGVWNMEKQRRTIGKLVETLKELEGVDREQYSQAQAATAFLLQAECFAALAADKKTKAPERKKLYGAAYDISDAVGQVSGLRDVKYASLMEKWRRLAGRPRSAVAVRAMYLKALQEKKYVRAARLYTEMIGQGAIPREERRQAWYTVGQCYYAGGRHYQAAICFSAVSKWFPKPLSKALEAARAAVGAQHKQAQLTKSAFDQTLVARYRIAAEKLDPLGTAGVTIREAKDLRKQRRFDEALALLATIDSQNKAYANALYETALTHKARFEALAANDRKSMRGKRVLSEMLAGFQKLLDYHRTALPKLTGEANADARERLTAVAGAGLLMLSDAYIRQYLDSPKKVVELTADLEKRYPGIGKAPAASALYMKRMHAGYILISRAKTAKEAEAYLPVVEESWRAARKFPDFQFLDRAASIGAYAYLGVAKKLNAEAKATSAAAAKKALEARAATASHRAVEFYIELLRAAPKQDIKIYRYVLQGLRSRAREEDYKAIIELASKAIAIYGRSRRHSAAILLVKTDLGVAHYGLKQYAEAIPFLLEVETHYETIYRAARKKYDKLKVEYERDPGRFRAPPSRPRRNALQPEVKEKLAFCYLASNKRSQYKWCASAYADLCRIYTQRPVKLWAARYNLCETYRRLKRFAEAIRLTDRWYLRDPAMGGAASKRRFQRLAGQILKDLDKLDDPVDKKSLKEAAKELYEQLRGK